MTKSIPINALVDLLEAVLPEIERMGSERPDREMTEASDVTSLINDAVRRVADKYPELAKTLEMHAADLDDVINEGRMP